MFIRFLREDYDDVSGIFTITAIPLSVNANEEFGSELGENSEDIGDTDAPEGIVNYITAKHPRKKMKWVHVVSGALLIMSIPLMAEAGPAIPVAAQTLPVTELSVRHDVYLRSHPRLWGFDRLGLIKAGSSLRVLERVNSSWFKVVAPDGEQGYVVSHPYFVESVSNSATASTAPQASSGALPSGAGTPSTVTSQPSTLPFGVRYDDTMTPVAPLTASRDAKFQAVLEVAQSKLGVPYIWGHNEDRGQYGFDCSNFTEYVFHHALGYRFSTTSRVQAEAVGIPVPIDEMLPGDLLIFNNGGHVGIYIGDGKMIEEGGGLGKVGYLRVTPGSYWYNHLTAVKRMF